MPDETDAMLQWRKATRIAALLKDRCQNKKCNHECHSYCPVVRSGSECIVFGEKGYPAISEPLCIGCGICIHKCPFDAIRIIGLSGELQGELIHQFGKNGFRLFRLPVPMPGKVVGLLGPNGIGKTTAISILSGEIVPNLGHIDSHPSWELVLEKYSGTELHDFLSRVANDEVVTALKPQYVDKLPKFHSGKVFELLAKVATTDKMENVIDSLDLKTILQHDIARLSGGELQRVAIAATMLKEADIYYFDEPSSYLDIYQRLKVGQVIKDLAQVKQVVVIEHDLAILDFLADLVYMVYGSEAAYGVISQPRPVKNAINTYLSGFLKEENVRFRDREIRFEARPPRTEWQANVLLEFQPLEKTYPGFSLLTNAGKIHEGEVVGVVGPNATGKTTFVQMLAGEVAPTKGGVENKARVSYKPQYIKTDFGGSVEELYFTELGIDFRSPFYRSEIERPLGLEHLYQKMVEELSGGELQRVACALALCREADLYLIDEPSAYLDSNQRMEMAKTLRRVMEKGGTSAMIVDHDVYFLDLVSDTIMVFLGESSKSGMGQGPFDLRDGMNRFLENVSITFRRDMDTKRPRINKIDSRLDREQKARGEYFYSL